MRVPLWFVVATFAASLAIHVVRASETRYLNASDVPSLLNAISAANAALGQPASINIAPGSYVLTAPLIITNPQVSVQAAAADGNTSPHIVSLSCGVNMGTAISFLPSSEGGRGIFSFSLSGLTMHGCSNTSVRIIMPLQPPGNSSISSSSTPNNTVAAYSAAVQVINCTFNGNSGTEAGELILKLGGCR